ncbi:hypothetical protein Fcan01_10566 [Folsomia candida]|uniref:VWFA domain-containing protein n=1 Tax=Folsomia candida TaxID=158441 RepID=A0A226EB01_FOLCA|nr:hypothetical protein Fcan01_10566 [Folsomia candida]
MSTTLIGFLLDVSGSMRDSLALKQTSSTTEKELTRAEYTIRKVLKICENEENRTKNDDIFILAFGLRGNNCCDLVQLLELVDPNKDRLPDPKRSLIEFLKANGAPYSEKYVTSYVQENQARFLCKVFASKPKEARLIANELPVQCRSGLASKATNTAGYFTSWKILRRFGLDPIQNSEKSLQYVAQLIRSFVKPGESPNSNVITKQQLEKLMDDIEPYTYDMTPMCRALKIAIDTFDRSSHTEKVLALVTDGDATDGDPTRFAAPLASRKIQVLTVLLTSNNIPFPRKLYFDLDPNWVPAHKKMFALSSAVDNTNSALSILLERGWELSPRGKNRLFVQANHPVIVDEFTAVLNQMFTRGSAVWNMFSRVSLGMYINSSKLELEPNDQIGGACYANAVAAALHLATRRVWGRSGGHPEFDDMLKQIVAEFGSDGAQTAMRRPIVARFSLSKRKKGQVNVRDQWDDFGEFFKKNPTGILKSKDIGNHNTGAYGGHAVLLVKCEPDGLVFMNSWGTGWADGGFFRVENADVLGLKFYDVFFLESDLKPEEIQAYKNKGVETLETLLARLPEHVKQLPYVCPLCKRSSPAASFNGGIVSVECPKCKKRFEPAPIGLMLG